MSEEKWMPVVGYVGSYEVSSHGRVASLLGYGREPRRILKLVPFTSLGHLKVTLHGKYPPNGENRQVHHLVLEAFVGPCPAGLECRHLDGNPANNRLDNLCWGTSTENKADKLRHGTHNRGEKHASSILTEQQIIDICTSPETQAEASARYGISQSLVCGIRTGKKWPHVPRPEIPQEILEERKRRGRLAHSGERSSAGTLTKEDVLDIKNRLRLANGKRGIVSQLAVEYGVTHSSIQQIRDGKSWSHV